MNYIGIADEVELNVPQYSKRIKRSLISATFSIIKADYSQFEQLHFAGHSKVPVA